MSELLLTSSALRPWNSSLETFDRKTSLRMELIFKNIFFPFYLPLLAVSALDPYVPSGSSGTKLSLHSGRGCCLLVLEKIDVPCFFSSLFLFVLFLQRSFGVHLVLSCYSNFMSH